jgi:hypothetical protein
VGGVAAAGDIDAAGGVGCALGKAPGNAVAMTLNSIGAAVACLISASFAGSIASFVVVVGAVAMSFVITSVGSIVEPRPRVVVGVCCSCC